jgi:hypothetical protein
VLGRFVLPDHVVGSHDDAALVGEKAGADPMFIAARYAQEHGGLAGVVQNIRPSAGWGLQPGVAGRPEFHFAGRGRRGLGQCHR